MAKNLSDISLLDITPYSITQNKNVRSAIAGIDPELRLISQAAREVLILPRLDELSEGVVDLLAWQYHVDAYDTSLGIAQKRALVRNSIKWHCKKGTPWAVKQVLADMGLETELLEWFEYNGIPKTAYLEIIYRDGETRPVYDDDALFNAIDAAKPASVGMKVMLHVYHTFRSTLNINCGGAIGTEITANPIGQDREHTQSWMINHGGYAYSKLAASPFDVEKTNSMVLSISNGAVFSKVLAGEPLMPKKVNKNQQDGACGVFYRTRIQPKRIE